MSRRYESGNIRWSWVFAIFVAFCVVMDSGYWKVFNNRTCKFDQKESLKSIKTLARNMNREIFGQHLAVDLVHRALYGHLKEENPKKALVLSFHGGIGCGKTHMSQLIAEALFEGGFNNPHVHAFIGPRHFILDPLMLRENQQNLTQRLEAARRGCNRALFIFDEVDKMPPEIFDVLVPYIDYRQSIDGVDYRGLMFIFLSNTGGTAIRKTAGELVEKGKKREEFSYQDFDRLIAKNAFSEQGGLSGADMIWKNLVDYFVPFLPLEKSHVIACAKRDIQQRKVLFIQPEKIADKILYRDAGYSFSYADDGCKSVSTLVNYYVREADSYKNYDDDDSYRPVV